jgi:threonine dehydratase
MTVAGREAGPRRGTSRIEAATRVPSPADIEAAAARIAGRVRATPTLEAELDGRALCFKLEFLQAGGTFKARGAFNRLLACDSRGCARPAWWRPRAATTASRSRWPRARWACRRTCSCRSRRRRPSSLACGRWAPRCAAKAAPTPTRWPPAARTRSPPARSSRTRTTSPRPCPGQGTVALEWSRQAPTPDTVLVAVGGGGLAAGLAAWWRGAVRVVAVESDGCPTLHAALAAGRPVDVEPRGLAADSLGARRIGGIAFEAARRGWIDRALLAPDDAIRAAQRALWSSLRVAAEPGGAAAYAALLCGAYVPAPGERVGVLLCGANVDPATLSEAAAS